MNYLITWFYAEGIDDESCYPSVSGNTSSPEFHKVYWRCVYDFFRTAQLTQDNGTIKYLFFTNVPNIPTDIDGFNLARFFADIGINVHYLELSKRTPKDWWGAWRNQFYLFDCLEYISKNYEGNFLILDSDIFITGDLSPVFRDIENHMILSYDCGYDESISINGISTLEMRELYVNYCGGVDNGNLRYKGGEFIGVTSKIIPEILEKFYKLWDYNFLLYCRNFKKLNEEAHFLSVIYHQLGLDNSYGNIYIKRMWTAIKCDNIQPGDESLLLWHLPAEKMFTFNSMFQFLQEDCDQTRYLACLRKLLHIPGNKLLRIMKRIKYKIATI